MHNMHTSTVKSLQELLKMVERKLWLAKTSSAFYKGTNKKTVERLCKQIVALEESISHFS